MRRFRSITSSTDANVYVGPFGELVVDNSGQIRIQDNVTPGGHMLSVAADTGNITFSDTTISTSYPASITIDSESLLLTSNLIPITDMISTLGSSDNMFSESHIGKMRLFSSEGHSPTIATTSSNLTIQVNRHKFSITDFSIGENPSIGTGTVFALDGITGSPGPTMETWYGNVATPWDPPGQHSLDIRGSIGPGTDNYVELASPDWNNYVGVNNDHVFIQTNWNTDPTQMWSFSTLGNFKLPPTGRIASHDALVELMLGNGNFNMSTTNVDNVTTYTSFLDRTGNMFVNGSILPTSNIAYSLGSAEFQWQDLWVSNATIYIGGIPLSVDSSGDLTVNGAVISSGGLPTVTVPGEAGSTYKGLQVSYGMVHSNNSINELNVNKIVINKPAITTTDIDPTSAQDYFRVSGVGNSDVLAMFIVFGDVNGSKSIATLTDFAQAVIDNVILDGGVEGQYNTLTNMKSAFYSNYATLASAANGLDLDFEFYLNTTPTIVGSTTVQEGGGATFNFGEDGAGGYTFLGVLTSGINYKVGHKLLVLGSATGGIDGVNDAIFTVTTIDPIGMITGATVTGASFSTAPVGGWFAPATNYDVGSGFDVASAFFNPNGTFGYLNLNSYGSNYVAGDVITLLGSNIQYGTSPANNITVTITAVDGSGVPQSWNVSGTFPRMWPNNSISDGGNDQYDTGNYINSSFDNNIPYSQGNTIVDGIVDGIAVFGEGAAFSFVYDTAMFGLLVTGNQSTFIETNGNSGADGGSSTEAGYLYGPNTAAETFDNAVTHINFYGDAFAGPIVSFTRPDNSAGTIDILIPDDGAGAGVAIARANNQQGIYNPYREGSWDSSVSPGGTLWNTDGWNDFSDVESRVYLPLYAAFGYGGLGNKIVGAECVMYLPDNNKYYAIKFDSWTQGGNGGGFAYTRRELDLTKLQQGIRFADGTRLTSAAGVGRIKLESPGSRRIEEVYGYKQVSVTAKNTTIITAAASRSVVGDNRIWVDGTATTIDEIINNPSNYNVWDTSSFEFSLDDITYYKYTGSISFDGNEQGFSTTGTFTYNQGDAVYFRYSTGGQPAVWWNAADLPGGSTYFRGATIDYHAYSGEATWIGSIHIADDSGEKHISHSEVASGSTDSENDDLWFVQNEGTISYRRIDGEGKTLKVQWAAKVFYGSEFWD